jgi:hypothetical protein
MMNSEIVEASGIISVQEGFMASKVPCNESGRILFADLSGKADFVVDLATFDN